MINTTVRPQFALDVKHRVDKKFYMAVLLVTDDGDKLETAIEARFYAKASGGVSCCVWARTYTGSAAVKSYGSQGRTEFAALLAALKTAGMTVDGADQTAAKNIFETIGNYWVDKFAASNFLVIETFA